MTRLQNIQPPLGMAFPALQSRAKVLHSFGTNEALFSNNPPSSGGVLASLKRIRTGHNLILVELTAPDVHASNWQDLFPSRQPEVVFLQVSHHGATATAPPSPQARESAELRWLREHQQDMTEWRGQWLLIDGDRLITRSTDFREIRHAITETHLTSPFTYYVPTEEEGAFLLL